MQPNLRQLRDKLSPVPDFFSKFREIDCGADDKNSLEGHSTR